MIRGVFGKYWILVNIYFPSDQRKKDEGIDVNIGILGFLVVALPNLNDYIDAITE